MTNSTRQPSPVTIGLDIGDRKTHFCVLATELRTVVARGSVSTNKVQLAKALSAYPGSRIVLEAGSQSPWMSRYLTDIGFDVHVADPRRVQLIAKDPRKTDRRDAETLARMEAGMPELLGSVHHRGEQAQADLSIVRARDLLVRLRGMTVQQVRGICKAFGLRLPSTSTPAFAKRAREIIPEILKPALSQLLDLADELSVRIRGYERALAELATERYPEISLLQEVVGIGPVTATAFVLTVEDPKRFADSRQVGSWLGLCPRNHASGDSDPNLRVTKAGNAYLRRLLVQCAQYILGPFGKDCDLRRFGLRLSSRGGSTAKKYAVVAVARKLAVLLHHLWRNGLAYDPLHLADQRQAITA